MSLMITLQLIWMETNPEHEFNQLGIGYTPK